MQLYQGDCLEIMASLKSGGVDLVLCDLPYGTTQNRWDSCIPFEPLWEQWHRLCKKAAPVLLFAQMPFSAVAVCSNLKEFRYEWVYEKATPTGFLNARKMPMKCHESILVFYRSLPTYNPQFTEGKPCTMRSGGASSNYGKFKSGVLKENSRLRYPRDVIRIPNRGWGVDHGLHPTQKPVSLCEYLIRTYTDPGGVVLDCCMGSGTTGVACIRTGREFIGIELDEGYFQTAKERLEREEHERTEVGTAPAGGEL